MKNHRKKKISFLANFVLDEICQNGLVDLHAIANYEELPVHYDHYESNTFDGMLVYHNSKFHIHINVDKGNTSNSRRGRFTLAHELGHYLIDEHRIALKYGFMTAHQSKNSLLNKDLIEQEADYFASCLLLPEKQFRLACAKKQFSIDLMINLSDQFYVSLMAAILRFIEIGSREFMIVVSKSGIVRWFSKSTDFAKLKFRFNVGHSLPNDSISCKYACIVDRDFTTNIEEVDTDTWFYNSYYPLLVYEQCYYSQINGYLITLVWFS